MERLRHALDSFLHRCIAEERFPAAAYVVGRSGEILATGAMGRAVVKPEELPATETTIWDAASLTKPLITATIALLLEQSGALDLDAPIGRYLPELHADKRELTFIDLLSHRSGMPAWFPFYVNGGAETYFRTAVELPLAYATGMRAEYSCGGYILTMFALERATGRLLRELAQELIFQPLKLQSAQFNPPASLQSRIAATDFGNASEQAMVAAMGLQFDHFRQRIIWGEVNDGNSYYYGGFAGNAGLFGTVRDLYELARVHRGAALLNEASLRRLTTNYTEGLSENRGIGWQLRSELPTNPSSVLSQQSFGHTGFTGTSVWIDPERDLILVLLTNRVHPVIRETNMQPLRREFHAVALRALSEE